jgi:hypothetical protein
VDTTPARQNPSNPADHAQYWQPPERDPARL